MKYFKFGGVKSRIKEWEGWVGDGIGMCIWKCWKGVGRGYGNVKKVIGDERGVGMGGFCGKK